MDEFIFTQFSCAKYGVLDLLIEYTKKIDVRINGGYIYNITIVNSANGNKAHMVIVQKIILPYEYRSLSNKKIKEIVKLQLQHSKELCDELAIAKTSSFEKEDKHTVKEENKIMEKNSIDKCVNIARNLNNMNDEEILLVYDMLLDQQRTALETSLFYQIYENKHKELKKLEARKIIDSYISDYYDQHHHESIYKYLMTRINEENME